MKRILSTLTLLLCFAFTAVNAQENYNATTMGEKVYLETANWGQNSPFNKQIFTSYGGSTNAKAGCVPTAYAIVMRYHGFPTEGTAMTLYNCQAPTYVEITDRVYDFSKMPLTYNSNWTQEQIDEVSKFFSHVLHACFPSKISTGSTEVNEDQTSKVLNDYFNYQLINASYQANFTMEQWIEKIKESIDNGCPIPYASNNSGTGDTRHMFVLDGYTANNYFHFNFGWNGGSNGWFKLDAITPSQGDNYSWNGNSQHYALFNLAPNKTKRTVTASVSPAGAGTVTVNGSANSAEVMEGTTATLIATANSGYTFSHWSKDGAQVSTEMTYKAKVAAESNDYVANFLTVGNTRVNVSVSYNSSYGTVTYNSNAVSGTGITPYQNSEVTLVATALDGYVFNGWTVTKGTNSTNYSGTELTFVATEDMSVEANFSLAVVDYKIKNENITVSGSSTGARNSTWTYKTTMANPAPIQLKSSNGSTEVYGLSNTYPRFYAYVYDANTKGYNSVTYTLSVPEGYLITDYKITYYVPSNYSGQVTISNGASTVTPTNTDDQYLFYPGATRSLSGTRSTEFTLTTSQTGQQYIEIVDFSVSVMSEGANVPSTPTTYTINVNAETGGNAYVNGTNTSVTVDAGTDVTLQAYPDGTNYTFAGWYNGNSLVSSNNPYTFALNSNVTYTAKFNAVATTYNITAEASPQNAGSVTINGEAVSSKNVNGNSTVTLVATPQAGYRFVEWTTTDGTHVSDENPYTVPAIQNVEDMVDVEYIAVFEEIEEVEAGTYYRIAYDFEVPVAAKTAATRAVGEVVNIDLTTGTFEGLVSGEGVRTIYSQWLSANGVRIIAEDKNNNEVTAMRSYNGFQLYINSLESLPIKYTIIVPEGYTLTSMKFKNGARTNDMTVVYGSETYSLKNDATEKTITFTEGNTSFTLSGTVITKNILITALTMTENGGETPETVRYYMQSVACGVSGGNNLQNALKMTQETGAASIFYYADSKLLSYDKGLYIKEDGGTRGLQAVGTSGTVTITTSGETATIAAPNYMHANSNGTTYYVDHCGSNPDNHAANHNFVLEEVASLPVTITDAGYATWYAPVAVQLPEGLTAYTITIHGDYAITGEGFKQVPANTGVILEGTKGKTTTYELEIIGSAPEVESIMKGTVAATYITEESYVLANPTDENGNPKGIGLYLAKTEGQTEPTFLNNSHKAYLPKSVVPTVAQMSAGFRFAFGGTTAIEEVETENENVKAIYDLTGRKLEGISGTGSYIIGGKKVLVK